MMKTTGHTTFARIISGEKLISLALQSAVFDGKPIFESKEDREGSGKGSKTMQRIGLTEATETWISEQTPEAVDLFNPIYVPMIVEPRPWTSLSEGGYLLTPMKLFKRQIGKRAQQLLEKADLSAVYSAVTGCKTHLTELIRLSAGSSVTRGLQSSLFSD